MTFPRTTRFTATKAVAVTPTDQSIPELLGLISSGDVHACPTFVHELRKAHEAISIPESRELFFRTLDTEWATVTEMQADIPALRKEFLCPDHILYAATLWPMMLNTATMLGKPFVLVANCGVLAITPHGQNKGIGGIVGRSYRFPKLTTLVSLLPD